MAEKKSHSNKVFISYAWGGESERIAGEVREKLSAKGLEVVQDKVNGVGFKGMIKDFMREIGKGNFVVVIISDKYLKSKNCMFELLEIHGNGDFHQRIFPIVLQNALIYEAEDIIDYTDYWDEKIEKLETKIRNSKRLSNIGRVHNDLDHYEKIRHTIDGLLDILSDMNTLTAEMHLQDNFHQIYDQIEAELKAAKDFGEKELELKEKVLETVVSKDFEHDIFLSFSNKDAEFVKEIGGKLRAYGLRVFMSNDSLAKDGGKPFFERINQALNTSKHFLLSCTPNAMNSGWVKHEYSSFFGEHYIPSNGERRLLILKGPAFNLKQVPTLLRTIQINNSIEEVLKQFVAPAKTEDEEEKRLERIKKEQEIATEEKLWELAKGKESEKGYAEYLRTTKLGIYEDDANAEILRIKSKQEEEEKKRLERIKKEEENSEEEKLWEVAKGKESEEGYAEYLRTTKLRRYAYEAKEEIIKIKAKRAEEEKVRQENAKKQQETIEEENLWILAKGKNTEEGYAEYLKDTKLGKYGEEAKELILEKRLNREEEKKIEVEKERQVDSQFEGGGKKFNIGIKQGLYIAMGVLIIILIWIKLNGEKEETPVTESTDKSEDIIEGLPLPEMVFVEGGTFEMGYDPKRDGKDFLYAESSQPLHTVELDDFYIGKYEVTNAEYAAFLNAYASEKVKSGEYAWEIMIYEDNWSIQQSEEGWQSAKGFENHPVISVTWYGAIEYTKWLSEQTKQSYRLPTEAEWEYAARGGKESKDYMYAGSNSIDKVGWYSSNSNDETHPVGQKIGNELGIYDMSGNVWEWCNDWYGEYSKDKEPQKNPTGVVSGYYRVMRGGSWINNAEYTQVAYRSGRTPGYRYDSTGFRISRNK